MIVSNREHYSGFCSTNKNIFGIKPLNMDSFEWGLLSTTVHQTGSFQKEISRKKILTRPPLLEKDIFWKIIYCQLLLIVQIL